QWYAEAALNTLLHEGRSFATNKNKPGEYAYFATQTVSGCESPSAKVSLTIKPKPTAPTAQDQEVCEGSSVPALAGNGENLQWYAEAALNTLLHEGRSFATNKNKPGEYAYFATQTVSGCKSPSAKVSLTIKPTPAAPTAQDQEVCEGSSVPALAGTGQNLKWYAEETRSNLLHQGNKFNTGQTDAGNYTYFATQTKAGCESKALTVHLQVKSLPDKPEVKDVTICEGEPVPQLFAVGQQIKWYQEIDLKTIVSEGNSFKVDKQDPGTYLYYVSQTISGCESSAAKLTFQIQSTPSAPEAEDIMVCENETILPLTANGQNLKWFSDPNLNDLIYEGSQFATGQTQPGIFTYYTNQSVYGCQSSAAVVQLRIQAAPEAPSTQDIKVCQGQEFVELVASGQNLRWYTQADYGGFLQEGNNLKVEIEDHGEYKYFVSQTQSGCESSSAHLQVAIEEMPPVPEADDMIVCASNDGIVLKAKGENVQWYETAELSTLVGKGNEISVLQPEAGEYGYFLTQTVAGCSSMPKEVNLTVLSQLSAPIAEDLIICSDQEIPAFTASGENLHWYADQELNQLVHQGNDFIPDHQSNGQYQYFVRQEADNCSSPATSVVLTIQAVPDPVEVVDVSICQNNTDQIDVEGEEITWYTDQACTQVFHKGNQLEVQQLSRGNHTFFVTQQINHCESLPNDLEIEILSNPVVRLGNDTTVVRGATITLKVENPAHSYRWNNGSIGPILEISTENLDPGDYKYWVEVKDQNSCTSIDSLTLSVTYPTNVPTPYLSNVELYPNPARGRIFIKEPVRMGNQLTIRIVDHAGQVIYVDDPIILSGNDVLEIDISRFNPGHYLLQLIGEAGNFSHSLMIR
ncbi:MAG: T9SS type A sorting domain-containing protein, partial [Candidatus Cyclobacteriaceae bacterium M3_2C_046]